MKTWPNPTGLIGWTLLCPLSHCGSPWARSGQHLPGHWGDQPATVRQCQVPSIASLKFSYGIGSAAPPLPLRPDFVSEDKIGNQAQGEEENPEDDEVQVKFGIFYIQFFQDGLWFLKVAGVIFVTMQVFSVQPVDGEDDSFEPVPGEGKEGLQGKSWWSG